MEGLADARCPLCGARDLENLLRGYDRQYPRRGSFRYGRCASCGVVRQDPLPDPNEIPGFYPEGYGPHVASSVKQESWLTRTARRHYYQVDSVRRSRALRLLFRAISSRVMPGIRPPRGENRVLDVGCGSGDLLRTYQSLGWLAKGVEVHPRSCEAARAQGIEVHQGTVFDAPYAPGSFDLVILRHVIEHVLDPVSFLRTAAGLLAKSGVLVLSTPNAGGLGFSLYGSCWYPLDAPRHLLLFDPRSIRRLGEEAGLRPTRLRTPAGARQLWGSRHYRRAQGLVLPEDPEARLQLIADSRDVPRRRGLSRRLVRLASLAASAVRRGEELEVDFVRV
jgi:2-polyprenyl-3-methyl-5-hydroxy-6-metoxy-1,4-benzoquinol methylase